MLNRPCRVLLVEDEPEDIERTKTMLVDAYSVSFPKGFELAYANTLAEGKKLLSGREFDVVLLDLILPDSRGIETLEAMEELARQVPIIVETAIEDEVVAVKALEFGASGYLPKIALDDNLIVSAIRAAIERQQQLAKLNSQQQPAEIDLLEQIRAELPSPDRLPTTKSLLQRMPDVFAEIEQRYGNLLERVTEQKLYKVEYEINRELNVLVEQLGYLQATPKDAIELHTSTLKQKQAKLGLKEARIFVTEGRYLLLEVMGKLAAYYQRYYIGLNKLNQSPTYNQASSRKDR